MCLKSSGEITYQFLPIMPSPSYTLHLICCFIPSTTAILSREEEEILRDTSSSSLAPMELSSSSSSFPLPRLHIIIIHLNPKARSPSSRCKMEEGNGHQTEREESRVEFIATFFPSPALPYSTRSEEGRGREKPGLKGKRNMRSLLFPFPFWNNKHRPRSRRRRSRAERSKTAIMKTRRRDRYPFKRR